MSYEAQHNALRNRFATEWDDTTPVEWPNGPPLEPPNAEEPTPPSTELDAWVRFVIEDIEANQASMGDPGNNVHRHEGAVVVMIFTPSGEGDQRALELADQAAAIYRGWLAPGTGLRFRRAPFIRRVGQEQKWYHVNVLIPFERDTHF